jgi:hypothetical protein
VRGGHLEVLEHTEAERQREHALRGLGGTMNGCFTVELAWRTNQGRLPRRLRDYRRDLWRRMEHGGARVVHALLDNGLDPAARDALGRTLLHRIHQFEHADLLPRLLAAGADVNAVSNRGFTPMCEALAHSAPAEVITALNAAGAVPALSLLDPGTWPAPSREPAPWFVPHFTAEPGDG